MESTFIHSISSQLDVLFAFFFVSLSFFNHSLLHFHSQLLKVYVVLFNLLSVIHLSLHQSNLYLVSLHNFNVCLPILDEMCSKSNTNNVPRRSNLGEFWMRWLESNDSTSLHNININNHDIYTFSRTNSIFWIAIFRFAFILDSTSRPRRTSFGCFEEVFELASRETRLDEGGQSSM